MGVILNTLGPFDFALSYGYQKGSLILGTFHGFHSGGSRSLRATETSIRAPKNSDTPYIQNPKP